MAEQKRYVLISSVSFQHAIPQGWAKINGVGIGKGCRAWRNLAKSADTRWYRWYLFIHWCHLITQLPEVLKDVWHKLVFLRILPINFLLFCVLSCKVNTLVVWLYLEGAECQKETHLCLNLGFCPQRRKDWGCFGCSLELTVPFLLLERTSFMGHTSKNPSKFQHAFPLDPKFGCHAGSWCHTFKQIRFEATAQRVARWQLGIH